MQSERLGQSFQLLSGQRKGSSAAQVGGVLQYEVEVYYLSCLYVCYLSMACLCVLSFHGLFLCIPICEWHSPCREYVAEILVT